MKIAIDCADLDSTRIDGTRVYIKNVLNYLGKLAPNDDFWLYHRKSFNPELRPKNFANYYERKIPYPFFWTQTRLAFELLKKQPAICWMPIQQAPLLISGKIKTVFTAHDLAFKIFPQHFEKRDLHKLNFFINSAVKRADGIIAISQATKQDLLHFFPFLNEKKIRVIYHGFENKQFSEKFSLEEEKEILTRFQLLRFGQPIRYLLYVGAIQPRKNLMVLIEAFEKRKEEGEKDLKLVLVGAPAWLAEETLQRVKTSKFKKDIILCGGVNFRELIIIYQKALLLVFPSLYEGFGLPILEGWASRVPVLVADNSSLKEIGGQAVEKFSAFSSDQLADKIKSMLDDETRRRDLTIKGTQELKKFSWEKCARETLEFLKEIAEKND